MAGRSLQRKKDAKAQLMESKKTLLQSGEKLYDHSVGCDLLEWDELYDWQQDNEYILSGYRPASKSFLKSLKSLGHVHNETVNIYSHLSGSVLFATLPFVLYQQIAPRYSTAAIADIIVFSTFFFGVAICFLLSATFHTFANHSKRVNTLGNQLDYLGIVMLIWGSTIPTVYYGFYCDPTIQKIYWTLISFLATACAITTLHPKSCHPSLRPYRAAMYSCLGLSSIIFIIHGIILHGYETQKYTMSLDWMGIMAALNLVGAFAYAVRIPEKWFPRRHDLLGSSHQILHFMVIFAGLAHMAGLLRAFDHIHTEKLHCT